MPIPTITYKKIPAQRFFFISEVASNTLSNIKLFSILQVARGQDNETNMKKDEKDESFWAIYSFYIQLVLID